MKSERVHLPGIPRGNSIGIIEKTIRSYVVVGGLESGLIVGGDVNGVEGK